MIKKLIESIRNYKCWEQICNRIKYGHRFSDASELRFPLKYETQYITAATEAEYQSQKTKLLSARQVNGEIMASEVKRIIGVIIIYKFGN
jgi:hypothetical protein